MTEIPSNIYNIIGILILANIGAIVSILFGVGKLVWWLSKLDSRVSTIESQHGKDIKEAHRKIRDIEKTI